MFLAVIQLPWILRGQLRAQAGSEERCPGEGPAGSADVSGEPANSQRPHPRHVAPRVIHPRVGCQVAGRCSPLLGRPPPSQMWDPRPCHPHCVAILGLPCPTLVRSGLQEKVFQAAPARRSVFLPLSEGGSGLCSGMAHLLAWLDGPGCEPHSRLASRPQPCHAPTAQVQKEPLYPLPLPPCHTHAILGGCIGWATETSAPSKPLLFSGPGFLIEKVPREDSLSWPQTAHPTWAQPPGGRLAAKFREGAQAWPERLDRV